MKKISSKIMFAIIACSLFISLFLGSVSTFQSSNVIKKEVNDKLIFMSQSYANEFSQTLKKIEGIVGTLSANGFGMFDVEQFKKDRHYMKAYEKKIEPIMKRVAETADGIQALYFTFNPELTGDVHEIWYADEAGNGTLKKLDPDPDPQDPYIEWFYPDNKDMQWYYTAIKTGKGAWSEPYYEVDLNKNIISYTEPIFKNDILVGVVGIDIDIEAIKITIENMKIYDTGYAFLMNEQYEVLINPSFTAVESLKTIEDDTLKFITQEIDEKDSGVMAYKLKGEDRIMGYAPLSNGWILTCIVPIDEIFEPMKNLTFIIWILTILGITLSIIGAIIFSNRVANPLICAVEQLKFMEQGDFTKEIPKELLNREDDLGTFVRAVDSMQGVIKDLVEKIKDPSAVEGKSSRFLDDMKDQTQTAANQAVFAVEQIARNAKNEAKNKKMIEEKLEKTTERLIQAQSFGHIGNWEWDIVNDKVWLSDEMYRIMGLKPKQLEITFEMCLNYIHLEDKEYVQQVMGDTLHGKGYSIEFRLIDFDGKEKWIYHRGDIVCDDKRNPICLFGISQDITEKKEALSKLKRMNETLKELVKKEVQENRKKDAVMIYQARHARMGQMIENITHQWKQPLNNINLILSNIKDSYIYDELSEAYLENSIEISKKILNQMSQTIDDFRWFFKPQKNKEKFLICDTIRFALELIEESIKRNNIETKIHCISEVMIYGYSNEFAQVVFNILNNAKDALVESKRSNKKIKIKIHSQKNRGILEISNNGGCIEEDIMDKIFEPYFTTKKEKGTGIGLYMSKMIVEKHMNGTMKFQNISDGVCCKIIIPNNGVDQDVV